MRKFYLGLLVCWLSTTVWADNSYEPLLNQVNLQFSAEQWVTTKTALVTVSVNASVADKAIENMQNTVLAKLTQISNKGDWHIVSVNRNQDQSGLERIQMMAQVRLANTDLNGLRDKAKAISKPGETYAIDNVEFSPSSDELRAANTALRGDIYQQVKLEIANLNKLYPDQKFYVHNINFQTGLIAPNALVMTAASKVADNSLAVGDKLKITALVTLPAAPNADVVKLVHA